MGTGCISCNTADEVIGLNCSGTPSGTGYGVRTFVLQRSVSLSNIKLPTRPLLLAIFAACMVTGTISLILVLWARLNSALQKKKKKSRTGLLLTSFLNLLLVLVSVGFSILPLVYLARVGTDGISIDSSVQLYVQPQCNQEFSVDRAKAEKDGAPGVKCNSGLKESSFSQYLVQDNGSTYLLWTWTDANSSASCYDSSVCSQQGKSYQCNTYLLLDGKDAVQSIYDGLHHTLKQSAALGIAATIAGLIAIIFELIAAW